MGQLCFRLFIEPEVSAGDSNGLKPLITGVDPFLVRGFVFAGTYKVFHLHLFELARAKDEIAGRDFVAERLTDRRDAEGQLAPAGDEHVKKIYEDPLRSFGPQIDERGRIVFRSRADMSAK